MYKIFIVEDDPSIFSSIKDYLETFHLEVYGVDDFSRVLEDFERVDPHLLVMDIGLPFKNGYYWTEEIRKKSKLPILFLSSMGEDLDQVMAMDLGADDFVVKPVSLALLLAKIKAQLRRAYELQVQDQVLEDGELLLNLDTMQVTYQGRMESLSKNEFLILRSCLQAQGRVIHREDLMNDLWQSDLYIDDNTLTVNVARLRKTLKSWAWKTISIQKREWVIMGPLKNKDSLLVLWGLTGIFFFSYIYVQSGRLADSLYGLGIYSLSWGGYFFYAYQRDKKLAEKIRQEGLEDYAGQGLLEEALVEEIHKVEKRNLDQENQFLQDREKRANYLLRWSHQIKIPMTAILAWLDAQGIQDKNPRFQVFKIQEYIDHILSYQRLQGRDTDYVFQWLPLKDPLQKALRTYAALFIHKGLRVQMDLPEVEVLSDAKWLLFFTKQWLSNVVKYTHTGGLTISFQEGKLIFQDTGIGIAPEDLPRVTDMGYTGFSGRKFDQSTGIGLYLMKEVAENLNLVMTLESQVGQGTRLILSFPKQAYKMSH